MNRGFERRVFPVKEFRVDKRDSGETVLAGYSAVFDSPSENLGWGETELREYILPGAFGEALKSSDCRALFNHDPNFVLGRESAGTLKITEDERGLFSEITLPETSIARDLGVSVSRGDIKEQSFCFVVDKDEWEEDRKNKRIVRRIHTIRELIDVSPVTYPAYPDTDIAKRSYDRFLASEKEKRGTARRLCHFERRYKFYRSMKG